MDTKLLQKILKEYMDYKIKCVSSDLRKVSQAKSLVSSLGSHAGTSFIPPCIRV